MIHFVKMDHIIDYNRFGIHEPRSIYKKVDLCFYFKDRLHPRYHTGIVWKGTQCPEDAIIVEIDEDVMIKQVEWGCAIFSCKTMNTIKLSEESVLRLPSGRKLTLREYLMAKETIESPGSLRGYLVFILNKFDLILSAGTDIELLPFDL